MPGSVANAAPATVLPDTLSRAFARAFGWPVNVNEYRLGESQRAYLAGTSRKSWRLAKRLSASDLDDLRDFFEDRGGSTEPFYFYDPWETSPKFTPDPTGVETTGRYTVRFAVDSWRQISAFPRVETDIELIELA